MGMNIELIVDDLAEFVCRYRGYEMKDLFMECLEAKDGSHYMIHFEYEYDIEDDLNSPQIDDFYFTFKNGKIEGGMKDYYDDLDYSLGVIYNREKKLKKLKI